MLHQTTYTTHDTTDWISKPHSQACRDLGARLARTARPTGMILTVWPSGDFHGGYRTVPKRDRSPGPLDGIERTLGGVAYSCRPAECSPLSPGDRSRLLDDLVALSDRRAELGDDPGSVAAIQAAIDLSKNPIPALGLSAEFISPTRHKLPGRPAGRPVSRRGLNGITVRGKRMVRSACSILEDDHGRGNLAFGTCTLPPLPKGDELLVAANLSKVIKSFNRNMSRKLVAAGLSGNIVAVIEIQTRRYERWGTLGYHLHWVAHTALPGRANHWAITPEDHDDCWARALATVLGYRPVVRAACKIEKPRKSVKREVSKYMSKGNQICKKVAESDGAEYLPTAWYSMSDALRIEIKRRTQVLLGDSVTTMVQNLEQFREEKYIFFRHIYIELPPSEPGQEPVSKWFGFAGHFLNDSARSIVLASITNRNNSNSVALFQNIA